MQKVQEMAAVGRSRRRTYNKRGRTASLTDVRMHLEVLTTFSGSWFTARSRSAKKIGKTAVACVVSAVTVGQVQSRILLRLRTQEVKLVDLSESIARAENVHPDSST